MASHSLRFFTLALLVLGACSAPDQEAPASTTDAVGPLPRIMASSLTPPLHGCDDAPRAEAYARGRSYMERAAQQRGFRIERELWLSHHADHGVFSYAVVSSLDISNKYPHTEVYFDVRDGHFVAFEAATGVNRGNTISSWLIALHLAAVGVSGAASGSSWSGSALLCSA